MRVINKLIFGISGLPIGTGEKFNYASGINYLTNFGLDAMELLFVRSDFAHIHARNNGSLKVYDDFAEILHYILKELGRAALDDLHIHMGGVAYSNKGEKHHLPLEESDFNFKACLKALKDFDVKGCVICEGPRVEKDALLLKMTYEAL